jgi:hypothetical protein
VDDGEWSCTVLPFEAVAGRVLEGDEIASMARLCPGARRRGSPPRYFRRRVGWWVDPRRVVTAVSEQLLIPQADGRFRATGEWSSPRIEELRPVGVPTRRVGDVRHDSTFGSGQTDDSGDTTFQDAWSQVAFLPEPVRRGIAARIPSPVLFEAQAVRYTPSRGGPRHTVRVLKMSDAQALVVTASRQSRAPTWQVEQVVYELTPRRRQLPR